MGDIFSTGMNSSDPRPHILSSAGSLPTLSVLTGSRTYPALSATLSSLVLTANPQTLKQQPC
ncbi:hypothetical protein ACXG8J_004213, partial [Enterobacter ludwigii]